MNSSRTSETYFSSSCSFLLCCWIPSGNGRVRSLDKYHYRKCPVRINSPLVSAIAIDGLASVIWRGFLGVMLPFN
jgi:hypothetical protein